MALLLLALLPVLPQLSNSTKADQYQGQVNIDTLQELVKIDFCAPAACGA